MTAVIMVGKSLHTMIASNMHARCARTIVINKQHFPEGLLAFCRQAAAQNFLPHRTFSDRTQLSLGQEIRITKESELLHL